jgi:hypothetical protein
MSPDWRRAQQQLSAGDVADGEPARRPRLFFLAEQDFVRHVASVSVDAAYCDGGNSVGPIAGADFVKAGP